MPGSYETFENLEKAQRTAAETNNLRKGKKGEGHLQKILKKPHENVADFQKNLERGFAVRLQEATKAPDLKSLVTRGPGHGDQRELIETQTGPSKKAIPGR